MGVFAHRLHLSPRQVDELTYLEFLQLKSYIDNLLDQERSASDKLGAL